MRVLVKEDLYQKLYISLFTFFFFSSSSSVLIMSFLSFLFTLVTVDDASQLCMEEEHHCSIFFFSYFFIFLPFLLSLFSFPLFIFLYSLLISKNCVFSFFILNPNSVSVTQCCVYSISTSWNSVFIDIPNFFWKKLK